jgi:DNA repair exonuclease SbcCD ATPase subunit
LQSIPESIDPSRQESNEPPIGSATDQNSPVAETQIEALQDFVSQLNDRLTNQTETINGLGITNSELSSEINDLDYEIRTLRRDQEPPNVKVINQTDSGWISYVLTVLMVAILIAATIFCYKRITSSSGKEGSQLIEENLKLKEEQAEAVKYFGKQRSKIEQIETENDNLKDSISDVQFDNSRLTNQRYELQSTVDKAQLYLENQEKLDDIKKTYAELQVELTGLIKTSYAAQPLLLEIVSRPIDTEEESYRASGRLELLEGLKTALDEYLLTLETTSLRSKELVTEIDNANAAKQIEFVKQLIDDRHFDSPSTIPRILENMLQGIGRTDVDEEVFSEIAAYKQHLADRFSSNDRTVPMAVITLLENLCRKAESGEVEAIEKLTKDTIQALKPIYGPRDNQALNPGNSPQD